MSTWTDFTAGAGGLLGSLWGAGQSQNTANEFQDFGAPSRDRFNAISADPSLYYNSPEAGALGAASDRRSNASFGSGSGTGQQSRMEAMMRGYGAERDRQFRYGGGQYWNQAYPGAQGNATNAGMGVFQNVGSFLPILMNMFQGGGIPGGYSSENMGENYVDYSP